MFPGSLIVRCKVWFFSSLSVQLWLYCLLTPVFLCFNNNNNVLSFIKKHKNKKLRRQLHFNIHHFMKHVLNKIYITHALFIFLLHDSYEAILYHIVHFLYADLLPV